MLGIITQNEAGTEEKVKKGEIQDTSEKILRSLNQNWLKKGII